MHVETDHQILAVGGDKMTLFDPAAGKVHVTASRSTDGWVIQAEGLHDITRGTREETIYAMTEHALALLPGTGYSTLVPTGLAELP